MRRTTRAVLGGGLVALLLSGCGLPWSGPSADDAATTLAAGLSKGSVAKVAFTDDQTARASYAALTKGVSGARVSVGHVSTNGDHATARLSWTWPVGSKTWTYDTDATLQKGADQWVVRWSPTLVEPSLKSGEHLSTTTLEAQRGDILGAGGSTLVAPRPVLRVGLDKEKVAAGQIPDAARRLAQLVGVNEQAFAKQVAATGPRAFVEAIVFRRNDAPPKVLAGLSAIPGGSAISDHLPLAPSKDFASAILGSVGPATAEIVKKSGGTVRAGDDVGLSGLQERYDAQLRGSSGEEVVAVDDQGSRRVLFTAEPVAGTALRTTIEPRLQSLAQRLLAGTGPASALVAVRPSTGTLAVVASGPGSKGYNTATYGRYAPGSTFKIVSALALLRAGETPSTTVPCTPTIVVDGKQFKNYSDYPSSQLGPHLAGDRPRELLQHRLRLPAHQARSDVPGPGGRGAGLRGRPRPGFPTFFGSVGPAGSETQAAASMIGQGTVLASPMAMATVVASVLKGSAVVPSLLTDHKPSATTPATPLTATEAARLRTMMRAVVTRGSGIRLAGLPGQVIAKTGTAEFGNKPPLPTHAWMVAGRGDLAVAVFVDRGQTGSQTAGPILQKFMELAK